MGPGAQPGSGSSNFGSGIGAPNMAPLQPLDRGGYNPTYNPPATVGTDLGPIPPGYPNAPSDFQVNPPAGTSRPYGG
jgi:hypothetical protein